MRVTLHDCVHERATVAGVGVVACAECGTVEWWNGDDRLDPAAGMARLFGDFDLVAMLPGVGAPAPRIFVYRPPQRRTRRRLEVLPAHTWLEAHPGLYVTQDGEHLLAAPRDPVLAANLARR